MGIYFENFFQKLLICATETVNLCKLWRYVNKMGNSLLQYTVVIGLHCPYLKAGEWRECFQGKFWSSLVLLFYMEAICLPVLKTLVHRFEVMQFNCLLLTQIYLYIPDLIHLANDVETNLGPNVLQLLCLHLVMKGHRRFYVLSQICH